MKKEEMKNLKEITDINSYPASGGYIYYEINGESIPLLIGDKQILKIENAERYSKKSIEDIQKQILSFSNKLYYPNFKNEQFLKTKEPLSFASKASYFFMISNLITWMSSFNEEETAKLQGILSELEKSHQSIYDFYRFQKACSMVVFIDNFYREGPVEEKVLGIGAIQLANDYCRASDDEDLIDMEYIFHCAKHGNYAHIGDYLKEKIVEILNGMLE